MDVKYLEQYIHDHIPLTLAMAIEVREATADKIVLFAPLEPNINHMHTVFGGSASTVAILSAWCLIFTRMKLQELAGHIVIHKNAMSYDKPIAGGFTAITQPIDEQAWSKVVNAIARHRMVRIKVQSFLDFEGQPMGHLDAEFVVLPAKD